jgi:quercetin dioxygenase-like cupin family protein
MNYVRWEDLPEMAMPVPAGTMLLRFVSGDQLTVARFTLTAGTVLPEHAHTNEQFSVLLSGRLEFTVAGEKMVVEAGGLLRLPANVPHGATALQDCVVLDVFAPPRADWGRPG